MCFSTPQPRALWTYWDITPPGHGEATQGLWHMGAS